MKYIKQFSLILAISFLGEFLNKIIPLPVPASIYGLVIMFICLITKIIPINAVKETATFLIEIMPLMFIPAAVGLLESWNIIKPMWFPLSIITIISTIVVMMVSGIITDKVIEHNERKVINK